MSYLNTLTMPVASLRRARASWDATPAAVAAAAVTCGHRGTGMPAAGPALPLAGQNTLPTTNLQIPTQIPTFGTGLAVAARDGNPGLRTRRRPPA